MITPYIYKASYYYFEKLTIASISKIPGFTEYDIMIRAYTPEYEKIFDEAHFLLNMRGLSKLIKRATNIIKPDAPGLFWKRVYEASEGVRNDWSLGSADLIRALDALPLIINCRVRARVMSFVRNEDGAISNITFRIGDPDKNIQYQPEAEADLSQINTLLYMIGRLAKREGYDLSEAWSHFDPVYTRPLGHHGQGHQISKDKVSDLLLSLHRWAHPRALQYAMDLQRLVFGVKESNEWPEKR